LLLLVSESGATSARRTSDTYITPPLPTGAVWSMFVLKRKGNIYVMRTRVRVYA
jgi:hypothetical protein